MARSAADQARRRSFDKKTVPQSSPSSHSCCIPSSTMMTKPSSFYRTRLRFEGHKLRLIFLSLPEVFCCFFLRLCVASQYCQSVRRVQASASPNWQVDRRLKAGCPADSRLPYRDDQLIATRLWHSRPILERGVDGKKAGSSAIKSRADIQVCSPLESLFDPD